MSVERGLWDGGMGVYVYIPPHTPTQTRAHNTDEKPTYVMSTLRLSRTCSGVLASSAQGRMEVTSTEGSEPSALAAAVRPTAVTCVFVREWVVGGGEMGGGVLLPIHMAGCTLPFQPLSPTVARKATPTCLRLKYRS